ncbi:MAG: amidohydrolase [Flavobacteriaceae bacterium]|nr:amidohydrolase [Flavobacteriaceae bacterium]MCY4267125.1 amidohydrolase [Flavobacteriaceae bacterium]
MSLNRLSFFCMILSGFCLSCSNSVDTIIHGATIYTVDENNKIAQAMAIDDGVIVAVGTDDEILNEYHARGVLDAKGLPIYPGFIDSHAHFLALGLLQNQIDLTNTKSFDEIIGMLQAYKEANPEIQIIQGRGWDQNDWSVKKLPTKKILDSLFPEIPIILRRIDGHAILVNQYVMNQAEVDLSSPIENGIIIKDEKAQPTGVLIDGAMNLVDAIIPQPTKKEKIEALKRAEEICFSHGITTVSEAGLDKEDIFLIKDLHDSKELKIKIYAMISNTEENLHYFLDQRGIISTDKLNVRSVKVYADGALGSRGAALKENYSDADHRGVFLTEIEDLQQLAFRIAQKETFQMNTHAIGDLANYEVLRAYRNALFFSKDPRWRIEHAQIMDTNDINLYDYRIIPSVQPTHATSDMNWVEERIGPQRMVGAYPYKRLLERSGSIALGTDFPVEDVSPLKTFAAAVARQDMNGYPRKGFLKRDSLSRQEALKGMTYWGAHANFEEDKKGSIEVGKSADFTILDKDIMLIDWPSVLSTRVVATFLDGDIVFSNRFSN